MENEVIEITEEEQAIFDKSVEVCKTLEGRMKTIKHVFSAITKDVEVTKGTIYQVLSLVSHPCIGSIEIKDDDVLKKIDELKNEIINTDPEWWKIASQEDSDES